MKSTFAVIAILALAFASPTFAQRAAAPVMPSQSTHRNHDVIDWNIVMARAFTNFDSIELTSQITNGSEAQFTFPTERESNMMRPSPAEAKPDLPCRALSITVLTSAIGSISFSLQSDFSTPRTPPSPPGGPQFQIRATNFREISKFGPARVVSARAEFRE